MKFGVCSLVLGGSVLALLGAWRNLSVARRPGSTAASIANAKAARPRAVENYGKLPMSFEVNEGQTDERVKFLARGQGYTLFLTSQEAVLALQKTELGGHREGKIEKPGAELIAERFGLFNDGSPMATSPRSKDRGYSVQERGERLNAARVTSTMLEMNVVGANAKARVEGAEELPGKSNYFIGNDLKKWRTNVATYAKVRVEDVYPGVDLVYYGNRGQLEYDFVVQPGADPSVIRLSLTGASLTKVDAEGDLVVQADGGEVRFHKPVIYQTTSTDKRPGTTEKTLIAGGYTIDEKNEVAFAISDYDRTKPLVIDPTLVYSTYLGGGGYYDGFEYNQASAIAVDGSGSAYVTGFTRSPNFPTTPNSYRSAMPSGCDPQYDSPCEFVFVTKFSPDGSSLVYSTFIGNFAFGYGIAVDASGSAYVTGSAGSGFPTTAGALQTSDPSSGASAFVTKLSSDGSALAYSTYLGGTGGEVGHAIAVDGSGNAYVAGQTYSHDFPTVSPIQATNQSASGSNAFVAEINPSGSALVYSTYLGGSYSNTSVCCFGDAASGIAVDESGGAYVVGSTSSTDFPTANAFQPTNHGTANIYGATINAFAAKISSGGSALVYSTYLGGSGANGDNGTAVAVDASGNAYVTGSASSADFPTTQGAFQPTRPNSNQYYSHAFVTKFSADGSALAYSTYLGGTTVDGSNGIAIGGPGFAYVTGFTASSDFPTADPIQAANNSPGGANVFVTELTPDGSALVYSTYLGGNCGCGAGDRGLGIAVDASRNAYVTGFASSQNFPTTPNAFQKTNRGADNAFVAKISAGADVDIANNAPSVALSGSTLTYSITVTNNGPDAASNVNIQDAIPAGTKFNSVATTSGSCTAPAPGGTGAVNCTAPTLAAGSAITETLTVNVTAGLLSTITDTATVSSTTFDPTNNTSATATTTVVAAPSIGGLTSSIGFGKGKRTFY